MEKQLRYVLMLSLKEMALRRVAVVLWNEPDILASIGKLQFKPDRDPFHPAWDEIEWRGTVECKVTDKMSKLLLPESLKKQMIPRLKAVGLEIPVWKVLHEAYLSDSNEDFNIDILEKLFWTTVGTVDYKKTAEELVRCDEVDIVKRFELACLYCLENYIPLFWNELPEENKKTFCNEEDTSRVERPNLQLFLPYILKRQPEFDHLPLTTIHTNAFEYSALCGNKTLTEYCFWKLSKEEREASLVQTAINLVTNRDEGFFCQFDVRKKKLSDVLCYLLSLMTPEEQIRIFKELSCEVLRCFLDWPWQDLFWHIADVIWTFLPERKYHYLLFKINVSIGDSGCYFPTFFQNLFLRSPIDFIKRFVDHECRDGDFFWLFLNNRDTDTMKVIFRNIDAADRVRLVFSTFGLEFIYYNIEDWHMVEVFLQEATLSNVDKKRLKNAFMEYLRRNGGIKRARKKWSEFLEFVDETGASAQSKSSSEDETLTKVKKTLLCVPFVKKLFRKHGYFY